MHWLVVARYPATGNNLIMSEEIDKARAKVESEYKKVAESVAEIHVAFHNVKNAGPEDDLYGLLDALEDTVHKARTGGMLGSGAKSHRKALEEYRELLTPPLTAE